MDISSLHQLLDRNVTYMGTFTTTFLNKVEKIFRDMQERGDNYLEVHEGHCGAATRECDASGQKGYQFVGNHTGDYLSLVFEQRENGSLDFCDCGNFKTGQGEAKGERLRIHIGIDELAGFHDPAYNCLVELGREAVAELTAQEDAFFSITDLKHWVRKFSPIYKAYPTPYIFYFRGRTFHSLYDKLERIVKEISSLGRVDKAVRQHPGKQTDKDSILSWFQVYEEKWISIIVLQRILEEEGFPGRVLRIYKDPLILLDCRDIEAHLKLVDLLGHANDLKYIP